MIAEALLRDETVDENAEEGRPHIEKIKTVEAVGNYQHISRQGGCVGFYTAYKNYEVTKQSAYGGVKQGRSKSAQGKIVGYKL